MNPTPPRSGSALAVIALICGISGWTLFPFLGSILAIIFGHLARNEIRRTPGMDGDGMAVAGLVLGYLSLVLGILAFIFIVLFFGGVLAFAAAVG